MRPPPADLPDQRRKAKQGGAETVLNPYDGVNERRVVQAAPRIKNQHGDVCPHSGEGVSDEAYDPFGSALTE
jgi:hypothetical protein